MTRLAVFALFAAYVLGLARLLAWRAETSPAAALAVVGLALVGLLAWWPLWKRYGRK